MEELGINPTQEKALQLLLSFKVITYENLVKVAFKENGKKTLEHIPATNALTSEEAKLIIDYGYKICNSFY